MNNKDENTAKPDEIMSECVRICMSRELVFVFFIDCMSEDEIKIWKLWCVNRIQRKERSCISVKSSNWYKIFRWQCGFCMCLLFVPVCEKQKRLKVESVG